MSPLQPVIDLLIRTASREETNKYTAGVAVLKAAEKVDKELALTLLIQDFYVDARDEQFDGKLEIKNQIRTLLESLPDPEPK